MAYVNDIQELHEVDDIHDTKGKYKSTFTQILSQHGTEIKRVSEERLPTLSHLSKKKLKDLIVKQNNETMAFLSGAVPSMMGRAEALFARYGHEIPCLQARVPVLVSELHLDSSLEPILTEYNEMMSRIQEQRPLDTYVSQLRWWAGQYKTVGEEVLRLETTLFQKIEMLDKLQARLPLLTQLEDNEALPDVLDSFAVYAEKIYQSSQLEENYKELVTAYKKWNVCRQLMMIPMTLKPQTSEPACSICVTEPITSVMVPCGHTFCTVCSRRQNTTCFICRGTIRERVKLFFT